MKMITSIQVLPSSSYFKQGRGITVGGGGRGVKGITGMIANILLEYRYLFIYSPL